MARYTVVWNQNALDQLAEIWAAASDRNAVSAAAQAVDQVLSDDPDLKGQPVGDLMRLFRQPVLDFLYEVRDADRLAQVIAVRHRQP